jgi:peptide/nickel transport system substrate-binding protein
MHSYWDRITSRQLSRRRALGASGGLAISAAFLAACGGGDDAPSGSTASGGGSSGSRTSGGASGSGSSGSGGSGATGASAESSLLSTPTDETAKGVKGGIFPYNHQNNVVTIDPHETFNAAAWALVTPVYSTMVKYDRDISVFPGSDRITGDAMQSWEQSPDGLRVSYKLRPNHKFDPRPPTNGRAMTVEDVKWSWERVKAISPVTADILREQSPTGVIEDFEVPDDQTVVVKLAEPYGGLQETLAYWYLYIGPVEGDGQIDLKAEARGTGPFRLDKWEQSVNLEYSRNDDWYETGHPFLDGMNVVFVEEPGSQEAQFRSGNMWTTSSDFLPDTILGLKKDLPHVEMYAQTVYGAPGQYPMLFGTRFAADVRLRRAVSMLYDRDALIEAAYGTKAWTDAGLDPKTYWDGHLSNRSGEWIDPSTDALGEGSKFFQADPEEAKKLLDAAGYTGDELTFTIRAGFGPTNVAEILHGMFVDGGLNVTLKPIEANEWREVKASAGGGFEDFLWSTANSYNADGFLATKYTPGGKDRVRPDAIPGITDSVLAMRREVDPEERANRITQILKDLAMEMPDLPVVSTLPVAGYTLVQPWLRNSNWIVPGFSSQSSTARPYVVYWYDKSKQ